MIFSKKEHTILFDAIRNYHVKEKSSNIDEILNEELDEYTNSYFKSVNNLNYKHISEVKKIPDFNLSMFKHTASIYKTHELSEYFYVMGKNQFSYVQKEFEKHGIDLLAFLQQELVSANNSMNHTDYSEFPRYTLQYLEQTSSGNYLFKETKEKKQLYFESIKNMIRFTQKDTHSITLGLLSNAIKNHDPEDQETILKLVKMFLKNNKSVGARGQKLFNFIKESIENWDLTTVFNKTEIKMLYTAEDGITAKKVEGLFYNLDLNSIKLKHGNKITVIGENIRKLINVIPLVLGDLPEYVGITKILDDPYMQINILFEKNVKEEQINTMNEIMKIVLTSKDNLNESVIKNLIEKLLLKSFLEVSLEEKEEKKARNKI